MHTPFEPARPFHGRLRIRSTSSTPAPRQRLPAGIGENPAWSAACALHMRYLELNDFEGDWHTEEPGPPGLHRRRPGRREQLGALQRALARPRDRLGGRPVSLRPAAGAEALGDGFSDGCMYTWPGYRRPEPAELRLYSYPGDGWRTRPARTCTSSASAAGRGAPRSADASLTGPDGPVAVGIVDNHTPGAEGLLPPGGILVPAVPLERDRAYTAQVTFTSDEGVRSTKRWSFPPDGVGRQRRAEGEATPQDRARLAAAVGRTPRLPLGLKAQRRRRARARRRARQRGRPARAREGPAARTAAAAPRSARSRSPLAAADRHAGGARCASRSTLAGFWRGEVPYRGLTLVAASPRLVGGATRPASSSR